MKLYVVDHANNEVYECKDFAAMRRCVQRLIENGVSEHDISTQVRSSPLV